MSSLCRIVHIHLDNWGLQKRRVLVSNRLDPPSRERPGGRELSQNDAAAPDEKFILLQGSSANIAIMASFLATKSRERGSAGYPVLNTCKSRPTICISVPSDHDHNDVRARGDSRYDIRFRHGAKKYSNLADSVDREGRE